MLDLPSTLSLHSSPQVLKDRSAGRITGLPLLCLGLVIVLGSVALTLHGGVAPLVEALVFLATVLVVRGLIAVGPGQARVVQLFGRYTGTVRLPGLQWSPPSRPGASSPWAFVTTKRRCAK